MLANCKIDRIGAGCKEESFKFLGHLVDEDLSWTHHIASVRKKISSSVFALNQTKRLLPHRARKLVYNSLVASHLSFGCLAYGSAKPYHLSSLFRLQKKAVRSISLASYNAHTEPLFLHNNILNLYDLIDFNRSLFMYKYRYDLLPSSFINFYRFTKETGNDRIRNNDGNFDIPPNNSYLKFPHLTTIKPWNTLPVYLKNINSLKLFKISLKSHYLSKYESDMCGIPDCRSCTVR